jgi:2-oxoglutarate dehydrogenase E1 component
MREPKEPNCRRVLLCSGKISYALANAVEAERIFDVAIVRIEQLYPFPKAELSAMLARFKGAEIFWCQEEPRNQGAWSFVQERLGEAMPGQVVSFVGRPPMAAPAGGSIDRHELEQASIIKLAVGI